MHFCLAVQITESEKHWGWQELLESVSPANFLRAIKASCSMPCSLVFAYLHVCLVLDPALQDSAGHLCLNSAFLDQGQLVTHQDSQVLLCKHTFHIVSVPSLYWCLELLLPMSRTCHFQFLYIKGFLSRNISPACRGCSVFLKNYLVLKSSTLKSR